MICIFSRRCLAVAVLALGPMASLSAQGGRNLSLDEALSIASTQSEAVRIAQAGVLRAQGLQLQARSQYLPQLSGTATYTRTLKSQFEALRSSAPTPPASVPPVPPHDTTTYYTPCTRYLAGGTATEAEKIQGLERFAACSSSGSGGIDFSKVGFGSANQYSLGLSGSLTVYSGGRVQAQNRAAAAGRRSADVEVASQRAKLALDVTEAYFDAVLADRLVAIAESSLTQTESVLKQTRIARQVGNQSEFDLLRAQVSRDNQMPQVINARTGRDLAYLKLKQLLNISYAEPVSLTTTLADDKSLVSLTANELQPSAAAPDTSVENRAPVRQVIEAMRVQEANLAGAKSEWLPTITLSSQYGRVAFPSSGVPNWSNFLTNWTVAVGASLPLFTGGRTKGEKMVAEAGVRDAQARVDQTRELAALDARQAIAQLEQSQAALSASMGTAEQAAKAYNIAEVRYREGISTQIELNDSRILLEQASANRASAVRNLQVSRMRIALLKDLPLGVGGVQTPSLGGAAAGATSGNGFGGAIAPNGSGTPSAAQRAAASAATSTIPQ
ncbi:MAG: TolC family protein [Gemmatimonadaceae bacterium]